MTVHARSPEDLDMLLEDAFVLRDAAVLADLFETGAVVASVDGQHRVTDIGSSPHRLQRAHGRRGRQPSGQRDALV